MSNPMPYIFLLNGNYLGFISADNIFSRDGEYLGWIENEIVWDKNGIYCGKLNEINGHLYILKESYILSPMPRIPKIAPIPPIAPLPAANISPITPQIGITDGISFPKH